jgi:hypothetical protein
MPDTDLHRGAKIGTRIAMLVSHAIIHTHTRLLDFKHKLAVMIFNTISNEISDEVDLTLGPLLKHLCEAHPDDAHSKQLMDFMAHGRGQFKAIVGSSATAQSLLWALGTVISNELAPASYAAIQRNPHLIPDPASIAQMTANGNITHDAGIQAIRENGYFDYWGNAWIENARQWPAINDLTDWFNKKIIGRAAFDELAQKAGYAPNVSGAYLAGAFTEVSWQDAALAYLRGAINLQEVYGIAGHEGIGESDVDIYLQTIGEPPGTIDMLEAFRRGYIDQGTLERGLKQSRLRNEWIPMLLNLRYSPMTVADAVDAAVQNHMSTDDVRRIAEENGLQPGQYQILLETAGAPLSRTELNDLYNRGLIGSDVVLQGLAESRLKNKYTSDAFALRRRLLEPRTLSTMVHNGAMTHETAIKKAMEVGYNAEDAAYLIASASNQKLQSYRDRLMVDTETMYIDGALTEDQLRTSAHNLGFSAEETQLIVEAADHKRDQRAFLTASGVIRSKFIGHHIDKGKASNMLDAIGMPATQREYLLRLWVLEESANVRTLTEAQVIKALKDQLISVEDAAGRLVAMGYSETDVSILLGMM